MWCIRMKVKVNLGTSIVDGVLVKKDAEQCMVKISDNRIIFCTIDNVIFVERSKKPIYVMLLLLVFIWVIVRFYHGF